MGEIREPIKRTSIEKKNKIIEKAFELICEKGYHNVTSIDIAKYAEVSTGIIYQYFQDKRDIFIAGIRDYADKIMFPMLQTLEVKEFNSNNLKDIISNMIDIFIKNHKMTKKAHEELMAMSHLDDEIGDIFKQKEIEVTEKLKNIFKNNNINISKENIHIAHGIIDNFCHEVVYHKHEELNYDLMKEKVIDIVYDLLYEELL